MPVEVCSIALSILCRQHAASGRCYTYMSFLSIVCKMLFMHNSLTEFLRLDSVTALAFKFSCILWNHPTDGS